MTPATDRIECAFPRRGVVAIIELQLIEAPATCQAVLSCLPIETDSYHTKWNGNEVFVILSQLREPTPENLTQLVGAGDVVLYYHPPGDRAAPVGPGEVIRSGYAELGFFYGSPARSFSPAGPLMGTRVGRVVEGLDQLARAAREMRRSGFEPMRIRPLMPTDPLDCREGGG